MLSQLIRGLHRQTFKSLQTQNYVKRFYSNQELNQKTAKSEDKDEEQFERFRFYRDQWEDTARVYEEYYRRYYDTKFDNKSSGRQTDGNNEDNGRNRKNNEKFKSNSYSFNECKYHLLITGLLEKVGYIGAAIVVGLHFDSPVYYSRQRVIRNVERLDGPIGSKEYDTCYSNVCGNCKYCSALISKIRVFSAPIRKNYIFSKGNHNYLEYNDSKITQIKEENNSFDDQTDGESSQGIQFTVKKSIEEAKDPIEDICKQLKTASIDYIESLNNMLGIELIQSDPEEAMRCWRSTKSNPKALFNMAVAYEKGKHSADGGADYKKAFNYYTIAASMGHKDAIYNLSLFYLYGKGGVVRDYGRAEALLNKAAEMGVKPAKDFTQKFNQKREQILKEKSQTMRSSSSAPNLTSFGTCSDFYKNENYNNNHSLNHSIANRV